MDSSSFGPALSVFTTTQPITVLDLATLPGANPTQMPAIAMVSEWNGFNRDLLPFGLDGIANYMGDNWLNMFDAEPLTNVHRGTWEDFEKSKLFNDPQSTFVNVLRANAKIPARNTEWMQKKYPFFGPLVAGTLDRLTVDKKNREAIADWLRLEFDPTSTSGLELATKKFFTPDLAELLKSSWSAEISNLSQKLATAGAFDPRAAILTVNMSASRKFGIPFSFWLPGAPVLPDLFKNGPKVTSLAERIEQPKSEFATKLNQHLQYQNLSDTLRAIATGASIETIYDEPGKAPYLERWSQAAAQFNEGDPVGAIRALTGKATADFRDGPASSDGDILYHGKKYFQVDDRKTLALKQNPYIKPEFATIDDPSGSGKKIQIARYEYPTAADFEKFKSSLRDDEALKEFYDAKNAGLLSDANSPKSRELTKKLMTVIFDGIVPFRSAADRQLFLASVHPFTEMNTEATACLVQAGMGENKILYSGLRSVPGKPDLALLSPLEDLYVRMYANVDMTAAIQAAFIREETLHPDFPRYFDVPELWQAGRKIADIGPDPGKFVAESKQIFAHSKNCVAVQLQQTLRR